MPHSKVTPVKPKDPSMPSKKRLPRLLSRCLLTTLLLAASAAHADFNDGVLALMTGDNEKALKTFVPLAETSDHAYAQYFLGRMYAEGRGVEGNVEEAAKWYRKAAEKGVQDAQYRLGGCYERGEGVPKDMEYAYGWYSVSAHIGNPKAAEALKAAGERMTEAERKSAAALAQEMIQKYGKVPEDTSRTK